MAGSSAESAGFVVIESNDPFTSACSNPRSIVEKYFKFIACFAAENLEFQCLLCTPFIKKLSVNRRLSFYLKKRLKGICAPSYQTFLRSISAGSLLNRKLTDDRSNEILTKKTSNETQLTIKKSLKAGSKFFETNYGNKFENCFE